MGMKVAPSLANVFMSYFEEKYIYSHDPAPDFYIRFLDDILIGWSHGKERFDEFVTYLNNCHKTIKFTAESSPSKVPFLDIMVNLEEGLLWTDLYCKPTDSHNYLHFNSAHPEHNKTSLPYSQYLRLKRICTRDEDFLRHSRMITFHFVRRGHPKKLLLDAFNRVNDLDRMTLLEQPRKEQEEGDTIFLITTYIPGFSGLRDIVQKNWGILSRSSTTKRLSEHRSIHGYRRPKNLQDSLVRAKLPKVSSEMASIKQPNCETRNKCNTKNCKYCTILLKIVVFVTSIWLPKLSDLVSYLTPTAPVGHPRCN